MTFARETTEALVKPLKGAIVRRYTTGAAVEAGECVYLDSSGYIQPTNADAVATNFCIGIAVQDIASGDRGDVVIFGPILCVSGATPGAVIYTSDTAGEPAESAGTYDCVVGVAESSDTVLVNPWMIDFS